MICSFANYFIFIKTRKTASTSVEIALSPYCAKDDVITPISRRDERVRRAMGARPQNYGKARVFEPLAMLAVWTESRLAMRVLRRTLAFYNHMPAALVRARVGEEFWNNAMKFTVERHPYERAVSLAYFSLGAGAREAKPEQVAAELDKVIKGDLLPNYPLYTADDKLIIDRVIRYEALEQELGEVVAELGLPRLSALPQAKAGFRQDRRPADEILSVAQKEAIQARCHFEFELMNYPM